MVWFLISVMNSYVVGGCMLVYGWVYWMLIKNCVFCKGCSE